MELEQIKDKLNSYRLEYKENWGTFKSFELIFHYVNFLKENSYTKKLLEDNFTYIENQLKDMKSIIKEDGEQAKQFDNIYFDPQNPVSGIANISIFKEEKEKLEEKYNR